MKRLAMVAVCNTANGSITKTEAH